MAGPKREHQCVTERAERFIFPIANLTVPDAWTVGRVTFLPANRAVELLADTPPVGGVGGPVDDWINDVLTGVSGRSVAVVERRDSEEAETALDAVRAALDLLRLFQQSRALTMTALFGLPGEVFEATVEYVLTGSYSAVGAFHRGSFTGWEFSAVNREEWLDSAAFQFVSEALTKHSRSEGERRAVLGVQLYSRAVVEHRADLKMIGIITAMEAMLIDRSLKGPQALTLARYVTWFTCALESELHCGRDKPNCAVLFIKPASNGRLSRLRRLGDESALWRCSQWRTVLDWYDERSIAAHGDEPAPTTTASAESAEYHFAHYLVKPVLEWLMAHQRDPIGDLTREVELAPEPPMWRETIEAIDRGDLIPPWIDAQQVDEV